MEFGFSDEQIETAKKAKQGLFIIGFADSVDDELTMISGPCGKISTSIIGKAIIAIAEAEGN